VAAASAARAQKLDKAGLSPNVKFSAAMSLKSHETAKEMFGKT
jgi:hypothetical protein